MATITDAQAGRIIAEASRRQRQLAELPVRRAHPLRDYRFLHNTASFFTHHRTEAEAAADFEQVESRNMDFSPTERKCILHLLTIHYNPCSSRRIEFRDWPRSFQDGERSDLHSVGGEHRVRRFTVIGAA